MKKSLLLIIVFAIVITAHAQINGGIKAGLNLTSFGGYWIGSVKIRPGFHLGGYMNIGLSKKFSFQPELLFSTAGAKVGVKGPSFSMESTDKFMYLSMPLSLQYAIGNFNVHVGPQLSFLMSGKTEYTSTQTDANGFTINYSGEEDAKKYFKGGDLGLNFGAGLNLGKFGISARYSLGIIDINDSEEYEIINKWTNNVIQVSALYKLFGK